MGEYAEHNGPCKLCPLSHSLVLVAQITYPDERMSRSPSLKTRDGHGRNEANLPELGLIPRVLSDQPRCLSTSILNYSCNLETRHREDNKVVEVP